MTNASERVSTDGVERRKAQRVSVEIFVRERDGERLFVHPATNLSACGIFLESHSYSQRNAIERKFMDLEFELPDTKTEVQVRGEVIGSRRVRGYSHGLAIAFVDISEQTQQAIATYVTNRLADGASVGPSNEAAPTEI